MGPPRSWSTPHTTQASEAAPLVQLHLEFGVEQLIRNNWERSTIPSPEISNLCCIYSKVTTRQQNPITPSHLGRAGVLIKTCFLPPSSKPKHTNIQDLQIQHPYCSTADTGYWYNTSLSLSTTMMKSEPTEPWTDVNPWRQRSNTRRAEKDRRWREGIISTKREQKMEIEIRCWEMWNQQCCCVGHVTRHSMVSRRNFLQTKIFREFWGIFCQRNKQ